MIRILLLALTVLVIPQTWAAQVVKQDFYLEGDCSSGNVTESSAFAIADACRTQPLGLTSIKYTCLSEGDSVLLESFSDPNCITSVGSVESTCDSGRRNSCGEVADDRLITISIGESCVDGKIPPEKVTFVKTIVIDECLRSFSVLQGHDDVSYIASLTAEKKVIYDLFLDTNCTDFIYSIEGQLDSCSSISESRRLLVGSRLLQSGNAVQFTKAVQTTTGSNNGPNDAVSFVISILIMMSTFLVCENY